MRVLTGITFQSLLLKIPSTSVLIGITFHERLPKKTVHERLLKQPSNVVLQKLVSMCDLIKMRVLTGITLQERLTSIIFHERLLKIPSMIFLTGMTFYQRTYLNKPPKITFHELPSCNNPPWASLRKQPYIWLLSKLSVSDTFTKNEIIIIIFVVKTHMTQAGLWSDIQERWSYIWKRGIKLICKLIFTLPTDCIY